MRDYRLSSVASRLVRVMCDYNHDLMFPTGDVDLDGTACICTGQFVSKSGII